jgi:beta-ureidopropionase / N-carbamoyl-L-amino-acid hydrolase
LNHEPITVGEVNAQRGTSAIVDAERLWGRLMRLAEVGAQPTDAGGGITRPALGAAHAEAAGLVAGWMRDAGLDVGRDDQGNVIGLWPGREAGLQAVALGSHLDTVPHGGAFDGALGVLAGLEAAQTLIEAGERLRHPLAVVAFADEEGNEFGIGVLSAQLWIGELEPAAVVDRGGRSLADALATFEVPGVPVVPRPELAAYLEAHVEQGPVLDGDGGVAAAVDGIVGISRTTVRFVGAANHAGTTPMALRRDALWGAAELALAVRDLGFAQDGQAVATVGVFEVSPGATNVIPGAASLRVELRALDEGRLAAMRAEVERLAGACAQRHGLDATLEAWHLAPAVPMHPALVAATRGALADAGLPVRSMPSWAGHDAKVLARRLPVGMLFVPSVGGVSHAPNEVTLAEHCGLAAQLLLHAARRVDRALDAGLDVKETEPA